MYNYLAKHFHYPDSLADNGAGGKVYVEFIIEPSGSIDQVRIKRGSQHALDEEALRVVKAMPAWRPAKMDGHAVAARMILPINYEPR